MPAKNEKGKLPFISEKADNKVAPGPVLVEKPPVPEKIEGIEKIPRVGPEIIEKEEHPQKEELERAKFELPRPTVIPITKTEVRVEIEKVMERNLGDVYQRMSPDQKRVFKERGEETAAKVEILIKKTKFKIRQVLDLIRKWLLLIPGVNKFFLEQEAKIKTDQILNLRESLKQKGEL